MSFPEEPHPLTGKAPEHEKNALKAHAKDLENEWGKSSIKPAKKEYLISWKDLSASQSWGIKDLLKSKYNIISNISTNWDVHTSNYRVTIVKDYPLTIEEARAINNDIDDIYKVIGTIFGLSPSGVTTPIGTEEQKLERIATDLMDKLLEKHEARRKKLMTQKEKIFTVPDDVTEKDVFSIIERKKTYTIEDLKKYNDETYPPGSSILLLDQISRIAEELIKSVKDKGCTIKLSTFSALTDENIKYETVYRVKSILIKKFDEMDKEKIFTVPDDITEKIVMDTIPVTKLDIVTLNIISKHKDTSQWLEKTSLIADEIIKSVKDKGYTITMLDVSYPSTPEIKDIKNEVVYKVKSILLIKFDEMDKQAKPILTDFDTAMQKATWASSHRDSKPKIKKTYECFFCKKRGMEIKFDNYVELKNHIESVHKLRRELGLDGKWVSITGTLQIKTQEEQVKEMEDEVINKHKKPNETWIYVPMVEVAKLIRNVLKIYFPSQKFSVRKSGGSAINVDWSGGPSEADIENIVGKYHSSEFDAMHDTTISLNRPWGNSYIFIRKQGD